MDQHVANRLRNLLKNKYSNLQIKMLFDDDKNRFKKYHLQTDSLLLDFSKNKLTAEILENLLDLANSSQVEEFRNKMFAGYKINTSENRAVLHTALRDFSDSSILVDGIDIKSKIIKERNNIKSLVEKVHNGEWKGFSGKKITDIVNIGIGGSDLGPQMVIKALSPYHLHRSKIHFVSNIDGESILNVITNINPETTLFIISSKSFTTQETLVNAVTARKWILTHYGFDYKSVERHFIAVSSALNKVEKFGIKRDNCFQIWDWIGGRYSLWSSIGIVIIFAIGYENFETLLKGAYSMDKHFKQTELSKNMPVILALLSILYSNFYHTQSQAILAYDERLYYFVNYMQQADMESNGKSYKKNGNLSVNQTATVLWGGVGTNGQHAFYQLLHQGNITVPIDFIAVKKPHHKLQNHQHALLANCIAQSQALMQGKSLKEIIKELELEGLSQSEINKLASQKIIDGNKPSNTIIMDKLTPYTLGELIALYEHKIFVQGIIWGINSFDQWGVELGKSLSKNILRTLQQDGKSNDYDSSTNGLLAYIS